MIHLDSNFLIYSLTASTPQHTKLRAWLAGGEVLAISTIAWAEFLCGPLSAKEEATACQLFPQAEPLLTQEAAKAALLFNLTGRRSRSLADCIIAAVAIRCAAKLASANIDDFQPFVPHGLVLT
jgi:predicted nucleic acid-binding protein